MEATEQKITLEVTETQYKHIQEVLAMNKPSKTRLTQQEKDMIHHMCSNWSQMFDEDEDTIELIKTIKKKVE